MLDDVKEKHMSAPHGPAHHRSGGGGLLASIAGGPDRLFGSIAAGLGLVIYLLSFLSGADLAFRVPLASPLLVLTALILMLAMLPGVPELLPVALLTSTMGSMSMAHITLTAPGVSWSVVLVVLLGFAQTAVLLWTQLARLDLARLPGITLGKGSAPRGGTPWPTEGPGQFTPGRPGPNGPFGAGHQPGPNHPHGLGQQIPGQQVPGQNPHGGFAPPPNQANPGPLNPPPHPSGPLNQTPHQPQGYPPHTPGQGATTHLSPGAEPERQDPPGTRRYSATDLPDPNGPFGRS